MTGVLPLEALLTGGRESTHPVALRSGRLLDYAEFVAATAAWRAGFGAHPGRLFALFFHDSFDFACALFGAWHAGKRVVVPGDTVPQTLTNLASVVDGYAGDFPQGTELLEPCAAKGEPWLPLDRSTPGLVVYTSGSTGVPAAIEKRLSQLFDEVGALESAFGMRLGTASVLATVSHQHIYGLLHRVLWPLAAGRPFAADRLAFPESIVASVAANGPAILISGPAHLGRLPGQLAWGEVRPRLRAVFSSGGPLPEHALASCLALLGQAPIEVYGSSETGGIAWRQRTEGIETPWLPLPGVSVRVEGSTLRLCSPHASGQWETVADRVRACPGGFELIGRADRVIKVEEQRVSLTAMELALRQSGLLEEARIVPLHGARLTLGVVAVPGERGWALHDRSGKRALSLALRNRLRSIVEPSALPRRFRFVWALPSDTQGKTREEALHALFDPRRPEARLVARDAATATLRIQIPGELPFFAGHFPEAPILPGVVLVEWAVLFGRELFALPRDFLGVESLKLHQVITPEMTVTLEFGFDRTRGSLSFRYSSGAGSHATGRILFGGPE